MILQNPKSLINAPLVFLILVTHMSYLDALDKVDGASGLDCVQLGQHFARVGRQGDQDAELGEGHQAHRRLGVGPQLRLDSEINVCKACKWQMLKNSVTIYLSDEINGILLGLQPGGQEVPVPHVLGVIHAERLPFSSRRKDDLM